MTSILQDPPIVLIAEDNKNDQFFLQNAFSETTTPAELRFFESAEDVITELQDGVHPNLIVTDLNMPGLGGFELLRFVKNQESLKRIPVIVFSGSNDPVDIGDAYSLYANSYVPKPKDLAGYRDFADAFTSFWLEQAKLVA